MTDEKKYVVCPKCGGNRFHRLVDSEEVRYVLTPYELVPEVCSVEYHDNDGPITCSRCANTCYIAELYESVGMTIEW